MQESNEILIIKIQYSNENQNQPTQVINRIKVLKHMYSLAGYINIDHCVGVRSLVDDSFYNLTFPNAITKETSSFNAGKPSLLVYVKVPDRKTKIIGLHNLGKAQCVNTYTILKLLFNSRICFLFD